MLYLHFINCDPFLSRPCGKQGYPPGLNWYPKKSNSYMTSNLRFTVRDLAQPTTMSSSAALAAVDQQQQSLNETSSITNNSSSSTNNNSTCSSNNSSSTITTSAVGSSGFSNNRLQQHQQLHQQQPAQQRNNNSLSCSSFSVDDNNCTTGPVIVNPLISPCDDDDDADGNSFGVNDDADDGDGDDGVPSPVNESAFNPSSGLFSHHESMMGSSSSKPNVIFNGSSLVNACNDYESRMQLVNSLYQSKTRVRSSSHNRTTDQRRRGVGNLISNPWAQDPNAVLDFESLNPRYGSRPEISGSSNARSAAATPHLHHQQEHHHPNHPHISSHQSLANSGTAAAANSEHLYECIDADSVNNFNINDYHVHPQQQQHHALPRHRSLISSSDPRILNV